MNQRLDSSSNSVLDFEVAKIDLPKNLKGIFNLVNRFSQGNFFLIGSSARKCILNDTAELNDLDFIGDFNLDDIAKYFGDAVIGHWDKFRTLKVRWNGLDIDFISRTDFKNALNGSDITISQMCVDSNGIVYDPLGYFEDLQKKQIRIEHPEDKIIKSPERILRVLRFAASLDYEVDPDTKKACIENAHLMTSENTVYGLIQILNSQPNIRSKAFEIAKEWGIFDIIKNIIILNSELKIQENEDFKTNLARLETFLGVSDFYVFGGSLRDIILGRKVKDFDIKFETTSVQILEIVDILKEKGFTETSDVSLPTGTYYINRNFNVISFHLDDILYDLSFTERFDPNLWRGSTDINLNALIFDNIRRLLLNRDLGFDVSIKSLELCNDESEEIDPLKIINALKQMSKIEGLIITVKTLRTIANNIIALKTYFTNNRHMRYKLRSIMGNPYSSEVVEFIIKCNGGVELLQILES